MDIEKLKNIVHPDANPNLTRLQTITWYVGVSFPFFIFTISAGIALWVFFTDTTNTSTNLSNIGFGMLIALSSVCFSYYKVLHPRNYKKLHLDVQKSGELFLTSAIAFIISSALKYSWTAIKLNSFLSGWFGFLIRISFKLTFLTAEIICIIGLAKLVDILHIRLTTPNSNKP